VVPIGVCDFDYAVFLLLNLSQGGIAHPGVYTSYDYVGSLSISKNREMTSHAREPLSLNPVFYEIKLQANFLAVSPAYLTTRPQNIYNTSGSFTGNSALKTTQTLDVVGNKTGFYVVRYVSCLAYRHEN
jgi:hypothetical protein